MLKYTIVKRNISKRINKLIKNIKQNGKQRNQNDRAVISKTITRP